MPNVMDALRNAVNNTGYGQRVSDDDLRTIAAANSPREAVEGVVRRLGGHPRDFTQVIDRIVTIVGENRTDQDAPAASGGTDVSEYADRLRTVAAGMGLPGAQVEQALREAGMIQDAADEDEEQDGDVQQAILSELKKIRKAVRQIRDDH